MSEPHLQNSQAPVLMALGELKGQMTSLQSFLASHTERMYRQDERMDKQDERMNEFSRKLHEHNQADVVAHEAMHERTRSIGEEVSRKIGEVVTELKRGQEAEHDKLENRFKEQSDKVEKKLGEHGKRIGAVETKMAVWAGVGAVIAAAAPVVMKMMGWLQ